MNLRRYFIICVLFLTSAACFAQDKLPVILGIQPGITKERFYDKKEFDLNILPLLIEIPVTQRVNLRFVNILNYHFGSKNQISDIGAQLLLPIFLRKREVTRSPSQGLYLAPLYGLGRNLLNLHYTHTVAAEVGYQFKAMKSFTLSLGIQLGGSYFNFDEQTNQWTNHFGIKVNLGWWAWVQKR